MKSLGKIIIWPANLDSTKTRTQGRRIPKSAAVQAPRLDEINEAARRLSLETEITPGKSRPGSWWEKGGYALVTKRGDSKTRSIHMLAAEIRKIRAAKTSSEPKR